MVMVAHQVEVLRHGWAGLSGSHDCDDGLEYQYSGFGLDGTGAWR